MDYMDMCKIVNKRCAMDKVEFDKLTDKQKMVKVMSYLRHYVKYRNDIASAKIRKNKNIKTFKDIETLQYWELLYYKRAQMAVDSFDKNQLDLYINYFNKSIDDFATKISIDKMVDFHDFILTGCSICENRNPEIVNEFNNVRNRAKEIICVERIK